MVYRLKRIKYFKRECHILLQNENGPCPLLAAANALLLRGACKFPASTIRNEVATLQDVSNMLAERAMEDHQHHPVHVNELVHYIPKFQYGMDVNLRFDAGIGGYEYTAAMTAFDMLRVRLVHGWLVDPVAEPEIARAVGSQTYNQIVERIIQGKEASAALERIDDVREGEGDEEDKDAAHRDEEKRRRMVESATNGAVLETFLNSTGHQLTQSGLVRLHEDLQVGELCVLFRNNHFGTLTKHDDGHLYLLVTDLGYANSPAIVWERLDVIDGDTEYFNARFRPGPKSDESSGTTLSPEQLLLTSAQRDNDYQLALSLSAMDAKGGGGGSNTPQNGATYARFPHGDGSIASSSTTTTAASAVTRDTQTTPGQQRQQGVRSGIPYSPSADGAMPHDEDDGGSSRRHDDADRLLALQLQEDANADFFLHDGVGGIGDDDEYASQRLAMQLQEEERRAAHRERMAADQRARNNRQRVQQRSFMGLSGRLGIGATSSTPRSAATAAVDASSSSPSQTAGGNNQGCAIQ